MVWASGGVAGALGDRAELVVQGVPNRRAPGDVHVDRVEFCYLPDERRLRDLRHIRRNCSKTRALGSYVLDGATSRWVTGWIIATVGRGTHLDLWPSRRRVDVVLGSLAEMPT
eukprot:2326388-Prymnesium_polylepis.1